LSEASDQPMILGTGIVHPLLTETTGDRMGFDASENMRHLPFFTELATRRDGDPSWRSVTAGLVVLRLVDSWIGEGAGIVAADSWGVRSVRAAIEDMPKGTPTRTILAGVVDALTSSRGGDLHAVAPRLMAYARCLDLDGQWSLAADVYETVIAHAHPVEDSDVAVNALLRRGHCLRELGELDEAMTTYGTAGRVARTGGNLIGDLRAQIGEAKILAARGNLPDADARLEAAAERAATLELSEVRSVATHDRSHVAHLRGQYDAAVRFAYDAMRDSASEHERERILNDLATSFHMLGDKSAARDAFLILASTAREQYLRWTATINLMELAAEDGVSIQFERYRQQLASAALPPMLQVQFELHVGRGYQSFGEWELAETWLERAGRTATSHSFNQLAFAADAALANNKRPAEPRRATTFEAPEDVRQIATELREMRELVNA
jgi:tetratricopeptide (TPR) repeat protein